MCFNLLFTLFFVLVCVYVLLDTITLHTATGSNLLPHTHVLGPPFLHVVSFCVLDSFCYPEDRSSGFFHNSNICSTYYVDSHSVRQ